MPNSNQNETMTQQAAQLVGLLLWRFGLMLASITALYRMARFLLQFIELPIQLEIGVGLLLTGFVLVLASLVMERVVDARSEGDLSQ